MMARPQWQQIPLPFHTSPNPEMKINLSVIIASSSSLTSPKPAWPKMDYYIIICPDIKIYCDLRTFCKTFGQKQVFGSNAVFLGHIYIACYTELNLQICNYAKKQRICCKIVNTRLPKICMAIFALAERLPTSATLFKF